MKHFLPFALCLVGFASLALATDRQQHVVFRRALPAATSTSLRVAGWLGLLLALAALVAWQGWSLGLVMFSGHTSLAAGLVLLALIGRGRLQA